MTQGENPRVEHYFFIHNVFGNFYKTILQYYSTYLYPRFQWTVMGTYDKAIEYINKKNQLGGRESDQPNLPALILNPSGDFGIADANSGAKQLYRFPNLAPGFARFVWDPIYLDENVIINVGFSRIMGDIELIMLCSSFYEYCDLRMYVLQIMGGMERYIYPEIFDSVIIIPSSLHDYVYNNPITNVSYPLDWTSRNCSQKLIETTNQNEWVIPCKIKPIFKLTSLSDSSTKYGNDRLSDWKLSASINFEVEVPSFMTIDTDYRIENLNMNLRFGSVFTKYPQMSDNSYDLINDCDSGPSNKIKSDPNVGTQYGGYVTQKPSTNKSVVPFTPSTFLPNGKTDNNPPLYQGSNVPLVTPNLYVSEIPKDEMTTSFNYPPTLDPKNLNSLIIPTIGKINKDVTKIFKNRYYHIVTLDEANSLVDWFINLPEVITDFGLLIVMSRDGKMEYLNHYLIVNNGTQLQIVKQNVTVYEGDFIELYVYDYNSI